MTTNEKTTMIEQWGLFELALKGTSQGNPFLEVEFSATFHQGDKSIRTTGFYDGGGTYRVRFMPGSQGVWRYQTASNLPELNGIEGSFTCIAPGPDNHGPVRVANPYHFAYADGTPYLPVGTTCYVWNLQGEPLESQTLETLKKSPFNKIRFCVFPKRYAYNQNDPAIYPFPGEVKRDPSEKFVIGLTQAPPPDYWDFSRFVPEYFQHLEQRIADLQVLGIEADLILFHPYDFGAWGFDRMPAEVNDRYLKYVVARFSAYRNLWWSFANEYELLRDRTTEDWDRYFQLVQAEDSYNHLRSVHNIKVFYDHTKPWVTHSSVQHGDVAKTITWLKQYRKPVVVDECGYEGDINQQWGNLTPQEMVNRFWLGFANGGHVGHGETYWNEEEVLWWSKGGVLKGESVARIAFLRQIIEAVPAPGLEPLNKARFEDIVTMEEVMEMFAFRNETANLLGTWASHVPAAGHNGTDYFLLYFGNHQPVYHEFDLTGSFRIDIIDTWEMTISCFAESVTGPVRVSLPRKPYIAIRLQRPA
ncbi:MAG: DUF5060 domain-containing protein [Ardenticatenaceae bacterium]|nr:DUF5060 domain-containing protein [Ardenticatenaceae bacterium]MCB9445879.1 DUF5060 domain-containing protein [Ardenticatenaceae bacterium]